MTSLLFATTLLIWHAANYLLSADPISDDRRHSSPPPVRCLIWFTARALVAAALIAVLTRPSGVWLAVSMFAGCFLLPVARWLWVPSAYLAELEIIGNGAFAAIACFLIGHFGLEIGPFVHAAPWAAGYVFSAALVIFVVRGGTYIVRGVLNRAGTMPPPRWQQAPGIAPDAAVDLQRALPVDTVELNHGRLIGNVERIILVLFIANGQYTALGFFFAAKGLIRSKDVERRAWADYLILGSLTSFLVAVAVGLLVRAAL
ncbi:MAG TPA: hypothetical protein VG456_18295 [Candidatus Sulfopaludibacter sp.]|jgi:hypothetical protein|nr:hypothetical protein [Candidatus Sulfopaludibacter sp.]